MKYYSNTRLPIVFCIDNRYRDDTWDAEFLDTLTEKIINDILSYRRLRDSAEVAFVFAEAQSSNQAQFSPVGSISKYQHQVVSSMAEAVICAYDLISKRTTTYEKNEIPFFLPMVIIIGGPDIPGNESLIETAAKTLQECCDPDTVDSNNIVIPIIFAVGHGPFSELAKYGSNNLKACYQIDQSCVNRVNIGYLFEPFFGAHQPYSTCEQILESYRKCAASLGQDLYKGLDDEPEVRITPEALDKIRRGMDELLGELMGDQ